MPAATRTTTTDLDRIVAHLCAVEDAVAEWTEPLPWGTAVFHRGVPWVREVNVVRVEATHAVRPGDIAFAAESRLPDAPAVEVLHEPIGADVAPAFAAAGWQVSRHLLMALEVAAPEPSHVVEEVDPELIWPLRAEWMRAEPWGTDGGGDRDAGMGARAGQADRRAGVLRVRGRPPRSRCACCSRRRRRTRSSASTRRPRTAGGGWPTASWRAPPPRRRAA